MWFWNMKFVKTIWILRKIFCITVLGCYYVVKTWKQSFRIVYYIYSYFYSIFIFEQNIFIFMFRNIVPRYKSARRACHGICHCWRFVFLHSLFTNQLWIKITKEEGSPSMSVGCWPRLGNIIFGEDAKVTAQLDKRSSCFDCIEHSFNKGMVKLIKQETNRYAAAIIGKQKQTKWIKEHSMWVH